MATSNFYVWLRSQLRRVSRRWPPVYQALALAKVPYVGDNKRKRWLYKCANCLGLFDGKQVAIDHVQPCGTLKSKEDIAAFVENLFCEVDNLQVLCSTCHDIKTLSERKGITEEEAKIDKQVLAFKKLSVDEQKNILQNVYDVSIMKSLSNATKRANAYKQYLEGTNV